MTENNERLARLPFAADLRGPANRTEAAPVVEPEQRLQRPAEVEQAPAHEPIARTEAKAAGTHRVAARYDRRIRGGAPDMEHALEHWSDNEYGRSSNG